MHRTLDYGSIPANALVWDFAMPPKSWSTLPLSSECLINEVFKLKLARWSSPQIARMHEWRNVERRMSNDEEVTKRTAQGMSDPSAHCSSFGQVMQLGQGETGSEIVCRTFALERTGAADSTLRLRLPGSANAVTWPSQRRKRLQQQC